MPGQTGRIFLSYRREDTAHISGWLADQLVNRFGPSNVFMDVDTIEPGADFGEVIANALSSCDVLIALIGSTWLTIKDRHGRRKLDDPDDIVTLEVRSALDRGILVIPVLVEAAEMPARDDLPEDLLRGLARLNAARLHHETFRSDSQRILASVERILAVASVSKPATGSSNSWNMTTAQEALGHPAGFPTGPDVARLLTSRGPTSGHLRTVL